MPVARHAFARLNTDEDYTAKSANEFDSAVNIHLEPGYVGVASGNVLVPYALPTGTNKRLGGFPDGATGTAVTLLWNSEGRHRLIRYDARGNGGQGSETTLLEWAGLNLREDLVVQGGIVDGLLVYLGADGYLRCVNLARATAGGYSAAALDAEPFALHLVKTPPQAAPFAAFLNASTDPRAGLRIIQSKAYQFAVRWRYLDGETTVLSPFSQWLDVTEAPATTARVGIRVLLPVAPSGVNEAEVLAREAGALDWVIADTLARTAGALPTTYDFYGVTTGSPLTTAEATRPFENEWPGKAAGLAGSRIHKGNLKIGYPTPNVAFTATPTQTTPLLDFSTFHEASAYRVAVQFYDAVGKPFGVSAPQTVVVPDGSGNTPVVHRIDVALTAVGAAQALEIPEDAYYYQFVVARNDRAVAFRQGQAADTRAFLGYERIVNTDGSTKERATLPARTTAHEKLWMDIGNWPAVGLGYVWSPDSGDLLRFTASRLAFPITGQYGDYVEVQWSGAPTDDRPLIEIYTPNTTASDEYYERGPRMAVDRSNGTRRYSTTALTLFGDCFLIDLKFPQLDFSSSTVYSPPETKRYTSSTANVTVQSPVPLYRLQAGNPVTTNTRLSDEARGGFFARTIVRAGGTDESVAAVLAGGSPTLKNVRFGQEQTVSAGQTAGVWLDVGYGGRPAFRVPTPLQQVERPAQIAFSGVKNNGNRLNGLAQWDALNQFGELPQEHGAITRLTVADQTQAEGSILLVNQERGESSVSLGQSRIQTADGEPLLSVTKSVIGGANALRGGYGCTDPASVVPYAGKVFFWCAARAELLRYDRNGLTPLGLDHKARARLEAVARRYQGGRVSACFDPRRKELLLTFGPANENDALTLVYSERREAWADALTCAPEAGLGVNNELVTYQEGAAWRHTPDAPAATFFGVPSPAQVTFSVASPGGVAKWFQDVAVESASLWLPTSLATDTALASLMREGWFTQREGVWRAGLRRAANSPGFPSQAHALAGGKPLIGSRLTVTLTAAESAKPLTAAAISWVPRSGQLRG